MRIEESILLNEIRKRNHAVYESLFYEYYPLLTKFAEGYIINRQASEDIVQSLFIYLWENAEKISIQESIKAYFYQSTRNRCLNYLRDLKITDKYNLLFWEAVVNNDDETNWIDPKIVGKIENAIQKLPPKMATIIKDKYLHGKKLSEISESLNISENTVKTQLQRAKKKLRVLLVEYTKTKFIL